MADAERGNCLVRRCAIGSRGSGKRSAMRGAPHQHELGDGERECPAAVLRHVAERQRSPSCAPPRDRLVIDPQRAAAGRQQTENRLEQCRFAFAVAPEHAQDLAGAEGEADAAPDDMPGIPVTQTLDGQPRRAHDHAGRRPKARSHKKTGVCRRLLSGRRAAIPRCRECVPPYRRRAGSRRRTAR